jgi:ribose-phosphate pyrophosphokinase
MFTAIEYPGGKGKQFEMFRYPGGEVQVRLTKNEIEIIKSFEYDKIIIVARIADGDIIPVAQLVNAVRGVTSSDIALVLPYLPYGRADRRFTDGDCCGLFVFGQMLNTFAGVEVYTLDAHSPKAEVCIRHFTDISPKPIIDTVIESVEGSIGQFTTAILLPDAGALRYGFKHEYCLQASKVRSPITGQLKGFEVPPKESFKGADSILIVDDICDGGGTFIGIADKLKDYGLDLYLYVTHGIFSKGFFELEKRFKKIYTTDSFLTKRVYPAVDKLVIIPCMGTILDRIVIRPELYKNAK